MNWTDLYKLYSNKYGCLQYLSRNLDERQIYLISSFTLYLAHATSILMTSQSIFSQHAKISDDHSIEFFDTSEHFQADVSLQHLIALDAFKQLEILCHSNGNDKVEGVIDVKPVCDFFDKFVKESNPGEVISTRSFTTSLMHKLIVDLKYGAAMKTPSM